MTRLLMVLLCCVCCGGAAAEGKLPAWHKKITADLDGKRLTLEFHKTPLQDVLQFVQMVTQIDIALDPRAIRGEKLVTVRIKSLPLRAALKRILRPQGLDFRLCCGALVISNGLLLPTIPADGLTVPKEQRAAYAPLLRRVGLDFARTPLGDVVEFLRQITGQPIKLPRAMKERTISVRLKQVTALQALALIATFCKGEFVRDKQGVWRIQACPQPLMCQGCARKRERSWKYCPHCGQKLNR